MSPLRGRGEHCSPSGLNKSIVDNDRTNDPPFGGATFVQLDKRQAAYPVRPTDAGLHLHFACFRPLCRPFISYDGEEGPLRNRALSRATKGQKPFDVSTRFPNPQAPGPPILGLAAWEGQCGAAVMASSLGTSVGTPPHRRDLPARATCHQRRPTGTTGSRPYGAAVIH